MKKIFALTFITLFLIHYLTAGKNNNDAPSVAWGDKFKLPAKSYELGFIGNATEGYIDVSHMKGRSVNLQKFDPQLKLSFTTRASTKAFGKKYTIEEVVAINNKYYLHYSTFNKENLRSTLFAQEISLRDGKYAGEPIELLSSTFKVQTQHKQVSSMSTIVTGKWKTDISSDSSKLLIHYRYKTREQRDAGNRDMVGLYVYDKAYHKIWGKEIQMPYNAKLMEIEDYRVDGSGKAYILSKVYKSETAKDNGSAGHYELLIYDKNATTPEIASLKFDDKYVVSITMHEDRTGRMICAGYYSKSGRGTDGAFLFAYDKNSKMINKIGKGFYEFSPDLINQFESKKAIEKSEAKKEKGQKQSVSHLELKNLVVADDGSITLFAEQYTYYFIINISQGGYGGGSLIYHHFFDDIYVTRINADGELKWTTKIPKAQQGITKASFYYSWTHPDASRLGLSFHVHTLGNDNYLYFTDNKNNLELKSDQAPSVHMAGLGGTLISVKIASDGTTKKAPLFDFREKQMNVITQDMSDVTGKLLLGRAKYGNLKHNGTKGKPFLITLPY
ncbi:MAG: hypothetical protein JWO03_1678 [Bacteroidetes bacterium]|nr:hypothetical protein [Bacteroidota bacterium]